MTTYMLELIWQELIALQKLMALSLQGIEDPRLFQPIEKATLGAVREKLMRLRQESQ